MKKNELKVEYIPKEELKTYVNNAKVHTPEQVQQIKKSIQEFGFNDPIAIWHDDTIIEGHGRLMAVMDMPEIDKVPIIRLDDLSDEERRAYTLVHNKLTMNTGFDEAILNLELEDITNIDMSDFGFIDDEIGGITGDYGERNSSKALFDKFIIPPFSVLDTRQGYWQERKRAWKNIGLDSSLGRDKDLMKGLEQFSAKAGMNLTGTSIFDPVLCEIMYAWFNVEGGAVYDCFAGGSVRGIVAAHMAMNYTGIDLRQEQIDANKANYAEIDPDIFKAYPEWHCDDSLNADLYVKDDSVDMVFTCPPYGDLEKYSDDPRDISNMKYDEFLSVYEEILDIAVRKLKDDRFAVIVIGDIRDKNGFYRGLTDDTKKIMKKAGLHLYNEFILVEALGTAALRCSKIFNAARKVPKTHQNVLVFYKGDPVKIKTNYTDVIVDDITDIARKYDGEAVWQEQDDQEENSI